MIKNSKSLLDCFMALVFEVIPRSQNMFANYLPIFGPTNPSLSLFHRDIYLPHWLYKASLEWVFVL